MPHRVVDFFRASNDSIHSIKASVQRRSNPNSRSNSRSTSRERPTRHPSPASSVLEADSDHLAHNFVAPPVKMAEPSKEKKDAHSHHRLSFPVLHLGSSKSSKESPQNPNASLSWKIESPPAVLHGDTENSTGALVSGQLLLDIKEEGFEVDTFEAKLNVHILQKRPFTGHCQNCANQVTELKSWTLLTEPTQLSKRKSFGSLPPKSITWLILTEI